MTVDSDPVLRPDVLRAALVEAKTLFDPRWLEREGGKRTRDPVHLDPERVLRTQGQIWHALRHGVPEAAVHPVAESLLVAERSLGELDRGQPTVPSKLFYRVLSLADVARFRSSVRGADARIVRLRGSDWKSALYELITAVSYTAAGVATELLDESDSPTPDIRLATDPPSYVECKARLQYERTVINFSNVWMREALLPIKKITAHLPDSVVIKVVVLSPQSRESYSSEIPATIREMFAAGQSSREATGRFSVVIERRAINEEILATPLPLGRELWKRAVEFDEWDDWHYVSEDGEVRVLNSDRRLIGAIGKAVIVCVRAEYLRDSRISVLSSLKDACRRQFEAHRPGIIHVLIDTQLFGLGPLRTPEAISSLLAPELEDVLKSYGRLWRTVIDLISESHSSLLDVSAQRRTATNPRGQPPHGYATPLPVLLV
jgi:hypothetical protein